MNTTDSMRLTKVTKAVLNVSIRVVKNLNFRNATGKPPKVSYTTRYVCVHGPWAVMGRNLNANKRASGRFYLRSDNNNGSRSLVARDKIRNKRNPIRLSKTRAKMDPFFFDFIVVTCVRNGTWW